LQVSANEGCALAKVRVNVEGIIEFSIYDLAGLQISRKQVNGTGLYSIHKDMHAGYYLVKAQDSNMVVNQKVFVK